MALGVLGRSVAIGRSGYIGGTLVHPWIEVSDWRHRRLIPTSFQGAYKLEHLRIAADPKIIAIDLMIIITIVCISHVMHSHIYLCFIHECIRIDIHMDVYVHMSISGPGGRPYGLTLRRGACTGPAAPSAVRRVGRAPAANRVSGTRASSSDLVGWAGTDSLPEQHY